MKEINGTLTLAYVEEDNRQRVIFRVIPLCTREGGIFHGDAEDFPDEGSLRIVPDKREQSTFKERMREINGLCVIQLASDGKELMKVRQNRNYAPDQGEKNRFAIYSDVICEFTEDGCFEVVEPMTDAANALTAMVLIQKDKMLYGPVAKTEAKQTSVEALRPFGNDQFLLHTVETPHMGKHLIYWNPEATLNWRQRRNSLRRKDRSRQEEKPAAEPKQEIAAEAATPAEEKPVQENSEAAKIERLKKLDPHTRRVERAAEILRQQEEEKRQNAKAEKAARKAEKAKVQPKVEETAKEKPEEKEADAALPIGTHLDILDSALPFEQQISRLAQPLSEGANRLSSESTIVEEEELPETVAHFSGTPLSKNSGKPIRVKTKPENVHHVVEQQILGQRDEVMGSELGSSTYGMVINPIENLRSCMEYVWQNPDMRDQALSMLMENEAFVADVADALRLGGVNLQAFAAAQEQLAEIEADRLSLLMQLDTAKENTRKFREEAIANAAQKKRDELERLKHEIKQLEATRRKLNDSTRALSSENAKQVVDFMASQVTCMAGAAEDRVLLSPVVGNSYTQQQLAEQLRVHMNASGFSISEDDAMSLLIAFSLYDAVCLRARTLQDARSFASILLESFGLQSVSAVLKPGAYVEMVSLLGEDANRTPTVTVQPLGTETMTVFGHKTIFLADESMLSQQQEMLLPMPIVQVPVMQKPSFGQSAEWQPVSPAALSVFSSIRSDSHPMLSEAEKWFSDLRHALKQQDVVVPDTMVTCIRSFIEVASRKVRGGFLAAADTAVCHWIVPLLLWSRFDRAHMVEALSGLPRALEQLGMH